VSPRSYVLVSGSAVAAISDAATLALGRWAAAWGASGDAFSVDAARLEESTLPAPADEWHPLHAACSWKASGLREHVAAAIGLPASAPPATTEASMSAQCVNQATEDLAAHLTGLTRDPRELGGRSAANTLPADGAPSGRGLVLVSVRRGPVALALVAEAAAFKAQPAAHAASAPALKPSELDTSLRVQTASLEVILGHTELSLADMMDLGPGDVLLLDRQIHQPLVLSAIDGQVELPVHLGRQGDRFAVQLMQPHQS